MSPRQKPHHPPSSPSEPSPAATSKDQRQSPRKSIPTATTITTTTTSRHSSIPTLPDVHRAPSTGGPQGSFLLTLLSEEERREGEEEQGEEGDVEGETRRVSSGSHGSGGGVRSAHVTKTKGRVAQEGQGHRLTLPDRSPKRLSADTLTARSDKILTASWSGAGGETMADPGRRGQRRRRSRDNGASVRRLSGPVPSRKRFKPRPGQGDDLREPAGSPRGLSSPGTCGGHPQEDDAKAEDLSQNGEGDPAIPQEDGASSSSASRLPVSDPARSDSEKCAAAESARKLSSSAASTTVPSDSQRPVDSAKGLLGEDGSGPDLQQISFDSKTDRISKKPQNCEKKTSSVSASGVAEARQRDGQVKQVGSVPESNTITTTTTITSSSFTPPTQPPEPFSQWTSCRALDDTENDDDTDNDEDDDDDDRDVTADWQPDCYDDAGLDGSAVDGRHSRTESYGQQTRKKRPLLLPPIMLPPIYTVKPTPLVVRDDVYFACAGARARRPISDEDWDKLRDCRYLRIRTMRKPLKV